MEVDGMAKFLVGLASIAIIFLLIFGCTGAPPQAPAPSPGAEPAREIFNGISFVPPAGFLSMGAGKYYTLNSGKVGCNFHITGSQLPKDTALDLEGLGASIASDMQKETGCTVDSIVKSKVNSYDAVELKVTCAGLTQQQTLIKLKKNLAIVAYNPTDACANSLEAILSTTTSIRDA